MCAIIIARRMSRMGLTALRALQLPYVEQVDLGRHEFAHLIWRRHSRNLCQLSFPLIVLHHWHGAVQKPGYHTSGVRIALVAGTQCLAS